MRNSFVGCGIFLAVVFGICLLAGGCLVMRWVSVAQEETDPRTLLNRYEWFKDAAARLAAMKSNIEVSKKRIVALEAAYAGSARKEWNRDDREQMSLWQQEVAGQQATFNNLAAEYNAAMVKINWAYCNQGDMPKGCSEVLPREFAPYIEK